MPKCHEAALLLPPQWHKEPPVPTARRGPQRPPSGSPRSLSLAHGGTLPSQVSGWSPPPLAQAFAPTLGQELCQGLLQWDPSPALGHAGKITLESWCWSCKSHPQSSQHHLPLTPLLYRHNFSKSSPRHAQAGPPGSKSPGVRQSRACSASSANTPYLQAQKSGSELSPPAALEPSSASASIDMVSQEQPDKCGAKPLLGQTAPS